MTGDLQRASAANAGDGSKQAMNRDLERADIQGNIIRAYGKSNYPVARYFFLHIEDARAGREFVESVRHRVTTAEQWDPAKPPGEKGAPPFVTLNIGFTWYGLLALDLPTRTLQAMPAEFIDGMRQRAHILGDRELDEAPESDWDARWDPIWHDNKPLEEIMTQTPPEQRKAVHVWISMNARVQPDTDTPVEALDRQTEWLRGVCKQSKGKVRILEANGRKGNQEYQTASAMFAPLPDGKKAALPTEHFGFSDGIGNPIFKGQLTRQELKDPVQRRRVEGRGKWMDPETGWEPLATGEFLLGHPDESQETAPKAPPDEFMRNGSFMVYRKLHQYVRRFRNYFEKEAKTYAKVMGVEPKTAKVILQAKVVGRWPDGVPLSRAGTFEAWQEVIAEKGLDPGNPNYGENVRNYRASPDIVDFKFGDDLHGYKCPNTSHLRRVNTRDYLDPYNKADEDNPDAKTQLNKRRRILRRGLPYGDPTPGSGNDESEQGVIFMAICSSLFRQFEFVQQQWIQYGLDFNAGNDTCPLVGNHRTHSRFVIQSDPATGKPPYICADLPQFVETRGGDYFFLPSLTALRSIAMGTVDPT